MAGESAVDSLRRDRLVYHRGRVIYALDKTSRDYRHVLEVPNGAQCGCVCEECAGNLIAKANLPDEIYLREEHFAHETGSGCQSTGERGLLEAFKQVMRARASITLPEARYSPEPGCAATAVFSPQVAVTVKEITEVPGWVTRHPDLMISTGVIDVRIAVRVRTAPKDEHRQTAEKNGVNLLWVVMNPDGEGKILLGDVLDELAAPKTSSWVHHVGAAAHERAVHAGTLARRQEIARRERGRPGLYGPEAVSKGGMVQEEQPATGTFWCATCRRRNARFIPDFPGSQFGKCAECGAMASPSVLQ